MMRKEVINLYKNLVYMGRDYPQPEMFRRRLKAAFLKNKNETDPARIKSLVAVGEFVIKELEALYMLRRYRTMRQRYYEESDENRN